MCCECQHKRMDVKKYYKALETTKSWTSDNDKYFKGTTNHNNTKNVEKRVQ